tara:strand:- start:206 stop:1645 length:1440 start_codon:yes stop_codon:yes gene_type:complete
MEELNLPNKVIYEVIQNLIGESEDDKYVSIGYGRYKLKGKEKDSNADVYVKDDRGKYMKSSDQTSDDEKPKTKQTKIDTNPFDDKEDETGDRLKQMDAPDDYEDSMDDLMKQMGDDGDDEPSPWDDEEEDDVEYLNSLDIEVPEGLSDEEIQSIVETEKQRRKFLGETADVLISQITQERGAGAYNVEKEDLELLKKFAQGEGPEVLNYDINQDDIDTTYELIEEKVKDVGGVSLGKINSMLQGKGAADRDSVRVGTPEDPGPGFGRKDKILESYLRCGGKSVVTGRPIAIGQSNVDHRLSLKNGGKDEPKNWVWMETNLNMLKKDLSDEKLIEIVNKELAKTPEEQREKKRKSLIKNLTKKAYTEHYKQVFEKGGNGGFTEDDIKSMTIPQMKNIIRGWNAVYGKKSEFYINTYKTQVGGSRADKSGTGGRGVSLSKGGLQKNMIEQLNKKEPVLSSEEGKIMDEVLRKQIEKIEKEN